MEVYISIYYDCNEYSLNVSFSSKNFSQRIVASIYKNIVVDLGQKVRRTAVGKTPDVSRHHKQWHIYRGDATLSSKALSSTEHWSNGTFVKRNIRLTEHSSNGTFV